VSTVRSRWIRAGVLLIVVVAAFIALYPIQRNLDSIRDAWPEKEDLLYLPSGNMLSVVSLGFDQLAADILYIRMIDYFSTHLMTDRSYVWFYHIADLVTTLDPRFRFPYIFAGLMLNLEGKQFDNARKILIKGAGVFPEDWYFPFALGLNYFFGSADLATAADYFDSAYRLGGPTYLKGFAAKLRTKGKTRETTIGFLRFLYGNFHDKNIKKIIQDRIRELETGGQQ
jgi:hypothetical protein